MNQRVATVLEEMGVVENLVSLIKGVGLSDILCNLQNEKSRLQKKQSELADKLSTLAKDLIDLQIS